jgi:hypothetical protein
MSLGHSKLAAIVAALAIAIAAFAVAGCGDDGDETETSSAEPLSKEEFIAQADEICESGDAEIEQQALDLGTGVDPDTLVTTVIVPRTRDQVEQIRTLVPPEGDEDEINEFLDTFDRGLDELENDPAILTKAETIAEARKLASDYGFKSCNTGGTSSSQPSGVGVGGGAATGPKGRFIAQADQICAQTAARTEKTIQDLVGGGEVKPEQLDEVAEITASSIEDQASGIRGLEIPEGDEEQVEAILTAAEEGAEEIRDDPESLSSGGVPNDKLDEANDLAVAYGLTVCGS